MSVKDYKLSNDTTFSSGSLIKLYPTYSTTVGMSFPESTTDATTTLYGYVGVLDTTTIMVGSASYNIIDIITTSKYGRSIRMNDIIYLPRVIWDALVLYVSGDAAFAGLEPSDFLDRTLGKQDNKDPAAVSP